MYHKVFISYSQNDLEIAESACVALERSGISCWIAPRDIPVGKTWQKAIVEAILATDIFVLILSESSNKSDEVARELQLAIDHKKTVVPYKIQEVILHGTLAFYLSNIQWLKAYPLPPERYFDQLVKTARGMMGGNHTQPLVIKNKKNEHQQRNRTYLFSIVIILGLIFFFIVGYSVFNKIFAEVNLNQAATAKAIEMSVNKEATVKAMEIYATQTAETNQLLRITETLAPTNTKEPTQIVLIILPTDTLFPIPLPTETTIPSTPTTSCDSGDCEKTIPFDKGAKTWFPDGSILPEGIKAGSIRLVKNEDAATDEESSRLFAEWKRETSFERFYSHLDGCDAANGLKGLYIQVIFFAEEGGARNFFNWAHEGFSVQLTDIVGENAYFYTEKDKEECPVDIFSVTFQRMNAVGRARVRAVEGMMDSADMQALAIELARYIDAQFMEEAQ